MWLPIVPRTALSHKDGGAKVLLGYGCVNHPCWEKYASLEKKQSFLKWVETKIVNGKFFQVLGFTNKETFSRDFSYPDLAIILKIHSALPIRSFEAKRNSYKLSNKTMAEERLNSFLFFLYKWFYTIVFLWRDYQRIWSQKQWKESIVKWSQPVGQIIHKNMLFLYIFAMFVICQLFKNT